MPTFQGEKKFEKMLDISAGPGHYIISAAALDFPKKSARPRQWQSEVSNLSGVCANFREYFETPSLL